VDHIKNDLGMPKYGTLSKLANYCVSILPHGNADPERGYSVNTRVLQIHGPNIGEDLIPAIRIVKDYLINNGG